jgi:hypothetical protein
MARENIRVYRFGDKVAVNLPDGPTQYFTQKQARAFSKALLAGAQNIKKEPSFSQSNFGDVVIPATGESN